MNRFLACAIGLISAVMAVTVCAQDEQVGALRKALQSTQPGARIKAARELGELEAKGAAAVPELIAALSAKEVTLRLAALRALGRIGPAAKEAAPALVKAVGDTNPLVRRAALEALPRLQASREVTLPLFVKMLEEAEPAVAIGVVASLAEQGEAAVPPMITALKHERACYWACLVLGEMGEKAQPAVPNLVEVLQHNDQHCRMQALDALGKIGPASKSGTESILKTVQADDFAGVRYAGLHALGHIRDPKSIPVLKTLFVHQDALTRILAAWAVLQIEAENSANGEKAAQLLLDAVHSKEASIRVAAVKAILETKIPPERTQPVVIEALKHGDEEFVASVIHAVASMGETATPRVIRALKNPELRHYAIRAVTEMGPTAKGTVATLIELLAEDDVELRREVQFAIGAIGPDAAAAVPTLVKAISDKRPEVRNSAAYALGKIGPAAKTALPELRKHFSSDDSFFQLACVWSSLKIQPGDAELSKLSAPLLTKALDDERELVRAEVAASLGELGEPAKSALPKLRSMASRDHSLLVRGAASEAVKKLE